MNLKTSWIDRNVCTMCGEEGVVWERTVGSFPLVRCPSCEFLQTYRVLDADGVADLYASGYGGLRQLQGQRINSLINLTAVQRLGVLPPNLGKVLDVGCGYGFFLDRLRSRAQATAGLELSHAEVEFAKDKLGLNVARSIDDLPHSLRGDFDLIVMFEVLEHISNPRDFIGHYTSRLKKGGVIVIGTDNFSSLPVQIMGSKFPKWIPHQHISLFDPNSLSRFISSLNGFEVISCVSYTPWELLVKALAFRITGGRVGGKAFDLESERLSENSRKFRLFSLRSRINRLWFRAACRRDLSGEMMFIAARRI